LEDDFAKIKIKVSEPIVSFKETIIYRKYKKIKRSKRKNWHI